MSGIRDLLLPLAQSSDALAHELYHEPAAAALDGGSLGASARPDRWESLFNEGAGQDGTRGVQDAGECEGLGLALSHMGLVMDGELFDFEMETIGG